MDTNIPQSETERVRSDQLLVRAAYQELILMTIQDLVNVPNLSMQICIHNPFLSTNPSECAKQKLFTVNSNYIVIVLFSFLLFWYITLLKHTIMVPMVILFRLGVCISYMYINILFREINYFPKYFSFVHYIFCPFPFL